MYAIFIACLLTLYGCLIQSTGKNFRIHSLVDLTCRSCLTLHHFTPANKECCDWLVFYLPSIVRIGHAFLHETNTLYTSALGNDVHAVLCIRNAVKEMAGHFFQNPAKIWPLRNNCHFTFLTAVQNFAPFYIRNGTAYRRPFIMQLHYEMKQKVEKAWYTRLLGNN